MTVIVKFPKVVFGFGAVGALSAELAEAGVERPLLVTDRGVVACGAVDAARTALDAGAPAAVFDEVPENPTEAGVERALAAYRDAVGDGIVALGGGSVIDTAKAVAILAGHPGPLSRYYGRPERITPAAAPVIAVPTTAGTGSEASRGAGIHRDETSRAAGVNSLHIVPRVAICDPELTLTLPPRLTAATGMDALSHCVEGFLSKEAAAPVEAVALDGVRRVVGHIERAVADGSNRAARWQLMMAALEGGMSIHMGLGPAHALANTFGDRGLHHGAIVTLVLPAVLRFLAGHVGDRMARLADAMGLAAGGDVAGLVADMNARLGLPATVGALGHPGGDLDEMAADAANSYFNARCAHPPTRADYRAMIAEALG